jgi:peptidoglycan/LPS O-acetylase OafA/YrhL
MHDRPLSPSSSVLLDLVRFSAALVVLYSHLAHASLAVGLKNGVVAGNLAVSVFFVLSGFVIRMVTVTRIGTARDYFIDRASRIYSVVLPCLLLTFLLVTAAWAINPARSTVLMGPYEFVKIPQQLFSNLTFTSQLWGYEISPPANGPFWSISFEVLYYAIYGLVFYSVKRRWFWVAVLLLIAGPSMVLNAPFWLLGCLTYNVFARFKRDRRAPLLASAMVASLLAILFAFRRPIGHFVEATGRPERTAWLTRLFPVKALLYKGEIPWLSRASSSYIVTGLLTSAFMLWALFMLNRFMPDLPQRTVKAVRLVANSTFTLYLLHLPLLMFIATLIGHPIKGRLGQIALPTAIITICLFVSIPLDRFMLWLRRNHASLLPHLQSAAPPTEQPQPASASLQDRVTS